VILFIMRTTISLSDRLLIYAHIDGSAPEHDACAGAVRAENPAPAGLDSIPAARHG